MHILPLQPIRQGRGNPAWWMKSSHVPAWAWPGRQNARACFPSPSRSFPGTAAPPTALRVACLSYSQWHPSHSQLNTASFLSHPSLQFTLKVPRCYDRSLHAKIGSISSLRPTKRSDFRARLGLGTSQALKPKRLEQGLTLTQEVRRLDSFHQPRNSTTS
jgi:hypothetical protein